LIADGSDRFDLMSELMTQTETRVSTNGHNGLSPLTVPVTQIDTVEHSTKMAEKTNDRIGLRGVVRTVQILYFLGGFLLYIWMDFRGWLGKSEEKKEETSDNNRRRARS